MAAEFSVESFGAGFEKASNRLGDNISNMFEGSPSKAKANSAGSAVTSFDVSDLLYNKKQEKLSFFYVASGVVSPLVVDFKAFVTSYEDQYISKWATNSVYGRMDPIATFENTGRKINLSFTIPSYDNNEATMNMRKMTTLINMLYPVYEKRDGGAGQIAAAPLIRMKFANLICKASDSFTADGPGRGDVINDGLLGYLDGVNFSPNIEAGFYNPNTVNGGTTTGLELYAMQLTLNCSFNVLHEHSMGFQKNSRDINAPSNSNYRTKQRTSGFPYNAPMAPSVVDTDTTVPDPAFTPQGECDEANYGSALGVTTDKRCSNSAVVTPEGSLRDSVVGKMFEAVDILSNF